jgi:hypothetical protein
MIEINLIPDVKQELISAQRIRSMVISFAILIGLGTIGIVILLGLWVFGVQTARGALTDRTIKDESRKLSEVKDLSRTLTIQNQLSLLPSLHEGKHVDSRIFDVLTTINPSQPNNVAISKLTLDSTAKTVAIEAQAAGGYPALEVFKKTVAATKFHFISGDKEETRPLATTMSDGDRSYGEDSSGKKVLRFSLVFGYPDELFAPYLQGAKIVAPSKTNVTDSYLGVPNSLFSPKANDTEGGE